MQKWVLLLRKETDLANIVQVDVLNPRHLTIHAMLHRHSWRVLRVPEGAHARQVHSLPAHPELHFTQSSKWTHLCARDPSATSMGGRIFAQDPSRSRALAGDHSNLCTLRQIQ